MEDKSEYEKLFPTLEIRGDDFLVGDEHQVRIVQAKDGWVWRKSTGPYSEPYMTEFQATKAAAAALGHHPRRSYLRG